MIDITKLNLNKFELYSEMAGMFVINSTSVLEACLFDKPIFTFGKCIFSNKDITYENITTQEQVAELLTKSVATDKRLNFINLLFERQIDRKKCSQQEYVDNHYWTNNV